MERILLTVVLLLVSAPGWAFDGNEFLERCGGFVGALEGAVGKDQFRSTGDPFYCLGFLGGIIAADGANAAYGDPRRICMPEGVTMGQGLQIVVRKMREHPELLHYSAASQIVGAMGATFPCVNSGDLTKDEVAFELIQSCEKELETCKRRCPELISRIPSMPSWPGG